MTVENQLRNRIFLGVLVISVLFVSIETNISSASVDRASRYEYFVQPVVVHIDKTSYSIGEYGVRVVNDNSGDEFMDFYNDGRGGARSQNVVVNTEIDTFDGDSLHACVMIMSTDEITCDYSTADYDARATHFYIDMSDAHTVD
jgi:hypothetical protein